MKRLLIFIMALIAALQITAYAESDISVSVNGITLSPEQPPVVINNRTLVPVRAVCEALGLNVEWNQKYQEVTIKGGDTFVKLGIDYHTLNVNNFLSYIDASPKIVNGVTCVPIRYVVEPFGAMVDWDSETKTVIVRSDFSSDEEDITESNPEKEEVTENTPEKEEIKENIPEKEEITENRPVILNPPSPSIQSKPFTFYSQPDTAWGFEANGRGYCWVCSYAMVISDATGDRVTPVDIAEYNIEKSEGGTGSYIASHFGIVEKYGLKFVPALAETSLYFDHFDRTHRGATYFKAETEDDVRNALIEALDRNPHGIMVRFEGYPHTLVATGYHDGTVYFNDPAAENMENVTFEKTCLGKNFLLTDLSFVQAVAKK
ncbi:MAG: copper amine oxidase N-terminal domain-containing protein [Eubacteriales bacterium]|nr:copper amine oxidase N-terminal domain-containing protein [Eubacteriales bacterium]